MSNRNDFTRTNPKFTGTTGMEIPSGTTGERPGVPVEGTLRYNNTLGLAEFYTNTGWAAVAPPPNVSNISGTINEDTDSTISITGSGFDAGAVVSIVGAAVSGIERPLVTTFVSSSELTAATNASSVNFVGGASFDVKVTNTTGLSSALSPAGIVDRAPVWTTPAGSLGSIYDTQRASYSGTSVVASDPDGSQVTYSIVSGSLPAGLSFNVTPGSITGVPNAVGSTTTSNFTVRASSNGVNVDRSFSITVNAPVAQVFSYTGGIQTWSKPAGVTEVTAYIWGAGGGGGNESGGDGTGGLGGCGGYTEGTMDVSSVSTLYVAVGGGGASYDNYLGPSLSNCNGCGGGLSGIFTSWNTGNLSATHAASVLIAGGGGGGGNGGGTTFAGGCGGGLTGGENNADGSNGAGGTQSSGGTVVTGGGSCTSNCTSGPLRGSNGCGGAQQSGFSGWPNEAFGGGIWAAGAGGNGCNHGGGGGGYYGGVGGGTNPSNGGAGGGGSGYIGGNGSVSVSNASTQISSQSGTAQLPPQTGSSYYASGIGIGTDDRNNGGHGRIVLVY